MAQIKNRFTDEVIAEGDTVREALKKAIESDANLRGANLSDADLSGADLRGANLRDADLRDAYLRGAYLRDADLRGAYLRDADLRGAYLRGADLRGADLSGADLRGANLRDADLRDAYLRGAYLRGASIVPTSFDVRGYAFYVTWTRGEANPEPVIRAGCKRWQSFNDARSHYGDGYDSNGDTVECLAIVNFMEARFKALTQQEAA